MALRELHLFAGAGGGILGGLLLGHVPVCAVELEEYPRAALLQRQRDGILPWFPVWDDVCTFDGKPWRGRVDVVAGGFPCQDISAAGRGAGIDGDRSGLWAEMARIIREVRPRIVFVENSPMLTSRGLGRVLGDLAEMGFDARWGVLGADDAGAPHIRKRIWIMAHALRQGLSQPERQTILGTRGRAERGTTRELRGASYPNANRQLLDRARQAGARGRRQSPDRYGRPTQPGMGGMADGLAERLDGPWADEPSDLPRVAPGIKSRVGRLKALGNGQVPQCAALAWLLLESRFNRVERSTLATA